MNQNHCQWMKRNQAPGWWICQTYFVVSWWWHFLHLFSIYGKFYEIIEKLEFKTSNFFSRPFSFNLRIPKALKKFSKIMIHHFKPSTASSFSMLSTSSQESVVIISQEWIQEWQKLFHKAKMLDSIMIKQVLKNRKRYDKKNRMLPKSHSMHSYVDHACEHKTIKNIEGASYFSSDKLRGNNALYVRSFDNPEVEKHASDNLQITVDGKLPMFVSTEELLEIKRQPYDTGESNCWIKITYCTFLNKF